MQNIGQYSLFQGQSDVFKHFCDNKWEPWFIIVGRRAVLVGVFVDLRI